MPMFNDAIFRWSDGQIDSVRRVYRGGTEIIEVITPCDTAILKLDLIEEDCGILSRL